MKDGDTMSEIILQTKQLCKEYGLTQSKRVTALKNVDIELERGRIYGLVGNNGSGKTTLMRIISGLVRATSGEISLFGSENAKELQQERRRVGMLVESPAYYSELSIMQNLKAQSRLYSKNEHFDLDELCAMVGIDKSFSRRSIRKCSLGQQQRYGIASALLGKPELLILDEPLNGLDPGGVNELRELLLRLNKEQGVTMLISSHILAELYKTATDYIFFRRGEVQECISAEELDERITENELKDVEEYFLMLNRRDSRWQS